jgi:L-asparaginase
MRSSSRRTPAARDMGTLVVLNDEINSAREVTKTDSRLLSTFSSRDYGVLGTVFDRVAIFRKPVRRHSAKSEFDVAANHFSARASTSSLLTRARLAT